MLVTSDSWPVPRKTDEFNFVGIAGFGMVKWTCGVIILGHFEKMLSWQ